jgi:hypothetical protein
VSGHSSKLNFCMFERSQGKHNNLEWHNFLEYFSLIEKFICSRLNTNHFFFSHIQSIQTSRVDNLCFFQTCTFGSKVLLTLNIMDFENAALTKWCSYVCDSWHECIII